MTSAVRLQQVMLVATLVVPAALFGAAVWQNHEDVLREGSAAIERTTAIMQEHARKVFETAELAIGQVHERIEDEAWDRIERPQTNEFLARLKGPIEQIVSLWVADADGTMRAGSQPWPPGSGIAGREFFQVHRGPAHGLYVGRPFTGLATSAASFAISVGLRAPGGAFAGTIHAAVSPAYFERFYSQMAPPLPHVAILLREDGSVLARDPLRSDRPVLDFSSPIMKHVAAGLPGGRFTEPGSDGVLYDYAFLKVGSYPAYVAFAVPHPALLSRWYRNLRLYGAVAATAALMLVAVSWLALRRAVAEQRALALLREQTRQRAEAELQLRHAQRMDAVGQLTGGVAHDFNNLLTAILGNLDLIQRAAGMPDSAERITRLSGMAMRAVQRGAVLTKSLLAFSRKQPLQPRPIDVNALLADFLDLVRQAAGPAMTVRFEPAAGLRPCLADGAELEAAVLNLAINARDAAKPQGSSSVAPPGGHDSPASPGGHDSPALPGGGHVVIRTFPATLDAMALAGNPEARPGAFVAVAVADDGPGMPPEVAAKAFEPFFTTKPIGQGTGLGLSQVFGFARQLHGHVTLASAPGQGTTVTIYIPVA